MRNKWDLRFAKLSLEISSWSSCCHRSVGAIIVNNNRIIATGYNGAPSGVVSCKESKRCFKRDLGFNSGEGQEFCIGVHAEQNAIVQAAKLGISCLNSTLYCTHHPCSVCAKSIINSGIRRIIYINDYPDNLSKGLLKDANILVEQISMEELNVIP